VAGGWGGGGRRAVAVMHLPVACGPHRHGPVARCRCRHGLMGRSFISSRRTRPRPDAGGGRLRSGSSAAESAAGCRAGSLADVRRWSGTSGGRSRLNDSTPRGWRPRRCQQLQSESAADGRPNRSLPPSASPPPTRRMAVTGGHGLQVFCAIVSACARKTFIAARLPTRAGSGWSPPVVHAPEADQWMSLASRIRINVK